jgi:hypothetical protein
VQRFRADASFSGVPELTLEEPARKVEQRVLRLGGLRREHERRTAATAMS